MGRVLLFALPAQIGLKGVQVASALLFLLTIYVAYRILKTKNVKYAEWVIPLIGMQPVLFNISYTSLAEVPAAFLIVLAFYFYLKDRYALTMLASSLVFIFRTEYFFVAGMFLLIFLYKKKWRSIAIFLIGPLLWYSYTTIISMNPMQFFYDMGLHARLPRIEEGIGWYYYIQNAPKIYGFICVLFFAAAIPLLIRHKKLKEYALLLLIISGGIAVHTLLALKGLDLSCSVGQLRYIAVVGPAFGIISAVGLSYFFESIRNRGIKSIFMIFFMAVMFVFGPYATPYHNKYQIEKVSDKIAALVNEKYKNYMVLSNLHYVANAMDEPASGGKTFQNLTPENMNKYDKAIIVWEKSLETSPFFDGEREPLKMIESNPRIKLIASFTDTVNNCTSIPIYEWRKEDYQSRRSREFIDYLIKDQTTWENIDIRVFVKE
jgi:hypothetical protein